MHDLIQSYSQIRDPFDDLDRLKILRKVESTEPKLLTLLFRTSDLEERCSFIRVAHDLATAKDLLPLMHKALQTNSRLELEALAHHNSYPRDYFPLDLFNQMVLKCIFTGLDVRPILGLEERINHELLTMVIDYASELRHAHRNLNEPHTYFIHTYCQENSHV